MRSTLVVRLVGPHLDCLAWEALLGRAPEVQVSHEATAAEVGAVTLLIGMPWPSTNLGETEAGPRSAVALVTRGAASELLPAVLLGVDVLVSPEDSLARLIEALRAAAAGNAYCSAQLLPALLDVIRSRSAADLDVIEDAPAWALSPREEEIAGLVATGLTNGQVACRLHVEERTVKSHLTSVYSKLAMRGRNDLRARWADLPKRYA